MHLLNIGTKSGTYPLTYSGFEVFGWSESIPKGVLMACTFPHEVIKWVTT